MPDLFPPLPITWATDTNYAAGADPWSGTPTKVEPVAGTKAKGFIPQAGASAQQLNYLMNAFASATNQMVASICSRWDNPRDLPATVSTTGAVAEFYRPFHDKKRKRWIHPGAAGSTTDAHYTRDFGSSWAALGSGVGFNNNTGNANNDAASGTYGDLLIGTRSGSSTARRFNSALATWSSVTINPSVIGITHIGHDDYNDTWIVLGTFTGNTVKASNAPDTTYVFTNRTLAGTPTTVSIDIGKLVISSTGVALFKSEANSFNRSTDGGSTWSLVTPPSPPWERHSYCWVPGRNEFVMAAANGRIYYSTDGATWTERVANSPMAFVGSVISLEAFGSVIFATYSSTGGFRGGLSFSLDGGSTWQFCGPGGCDFDTSGRSSLVAGEDAVMAYGLLDTTAANGKGFSFLKGLARNAVTVF